MSTRLAHRDKTPFPHPSVPPLNLCQRPAKGLTRLLSYRQFKQPEQYHPIPTLLVSTLFSFQHDGEAIQPSPVTIQREASRRKATTTISVSTIPANSSSNNRNNNTNTNTNNNTNFGLNITSEILMRPIQSGGQKKKDDNFWIQPRQLKSNQQDKKSKTHPFFLLEQPTNGAATMQVESASTHRAVQLVDQSSGQPARNRRTLTPLNNTTSPLFSFESDSIYLDARPYLDGRASQSPTEMVKSEDVTSRIGQLILEPNSDSGLKESQASTSTNPSGLAGAETQSSLSQQNSASEHTVTSSPKNSKRSQDSVVQASSNCLFGGESQESSSGSVSTLESFSLRTILQTPRLQKSNEVRVLPIQIEPRCPPILLQQAKEVSPSSSGPSQDGKIKDYLEEDDVEFVEEEPIQNEERSLQDIGKRVVEEFDNLGIRSGKGMARRASVSVGAGQGSSSMMEGLQKTWVFESEKEAKRRQEALDARLKDLTIEPISKAEMAYVKIEIWTESRKGKWITKGPGKQESIVGDGLPREIDPWAVPIDSKGVVHRKKLKSNVELSSTKTTILCPGCSQGQTLFNLCRTCGNAGCVEMVYSVQCIIRLAQFTPLKLPALLLSGVRLPHIKYTDTCDPGQVIDTLRDRALDGLQIAASRVVKAHYNHHGARLLMGRATITRIGLLSVTVTSNKTKSIRYFDIEDGWKGNIAEINCPARDNSTYGPSSTLQGRSGLSSSPIGPLLSLPSVKSSSFQHTHSLETDPYAATSPIFAFGQLKAKRSIKKLFGR